MKTKKKIIIVALIALIVFTLIYFVMNSGAKKTEATAPGETPGDEAPGGAGTPNPTAPQDDCTKTFTGLDWNKNLKKGSKNSEVKWLQNLLKAFTSATFTSTCYFGDQTLQTLQALTGKSETSMNEFIKWLNDNYKNKVIKALHNGTKVYNESTIPGIPNISDVFKVAGKGETLGAVTEITKTGYYKMNILGLNKYVMCSFAA